MTTTDLRKELGAVLAFVRDPQPYEEIDAMVSAINFLRTHGQALMDELEPEVVGYRARVVPGGTSWLEISAEEYPAYSAHEGWETQRLVLHPGDRSAPTHCKLCNGTGRCCSYDRRTESYANVDCPCEEHPQRPDGGEPTGWLHEIEWTDGWGSPSYVHGSARPKPHVEQCPEKTRHIAARMVKSERMTPLFAAAPAPPAVGEGDVLDGEFLLCVDPNNPDSELVPLQWGLSTGTGKTARTLLHFKDANTAPPSRDADIGVGVDHTDDGTHVVVRKGYTIVYSQFHPRLSATPRQPPVQDARDGVDEIALRRIVHELRTYDPRGDEYDGMHIHGVWASEIEAAITQPPQQADGGAVKRRPECIDCHEADPCLCGGCAASRYAGSPPKSPAVSVDDAMVDRALNAIWKPPFCNETRELMRAALLATIGGVKP